MKTAVIYESGTGFTKQYAEWISEALNCECVNRKKISKKEILSYDRIIYGGWIFGGQIMGLKEIKEIASPYAVFAVGCSPADYEEVVNQIKVMNAVGLENQPPMFYLEGGLHFEKLGFFKKFILKAIKKVVNQKIEKTRQEEFMAQNLATSFDHSDKTQIKELVDYCNNH